MGRVLRILVPVDLSEPSRRALSYAAAVAERLGATIHVLYVWTSPELGEPDFDGLRHLDGRLLRVACQKRAKAAVDGFVSGVSGSLSACIGRRVAHGDVSTVILETARRHRYDLIVIGRQGRSGRERAFAGRVAQNTIRHAPCPVLAVT